MQDTERAEWEAVAAVLEQWSDGTAVACSGGHEAVALAVEVEGVLHVHVASVTAVPVTA